MKKIIILITVVISSQFCDAQVVYNTSAGFARFICESDPTMTQSFVNQPTCVDGSVKLYYYYRPAITLTSSSLFDINANSGTTESSVKVWRFDTKYEATNNYSTETPILELSPAYTYSVMHEITVGKFYLLELTVNSCDANVSITSLKGEYFDDSWGEEECVGCLGGFQPTGGTYLLSAWVLDKEAALGTVDYSKPHIQVTSGSTVTDCHASGEIIDGWQRIEKEVIIEEGEALNIELICDLGGDCRFDDIRFFPKDGSLVTYVYDPLTLRLMAELDERNYAKIYEYDEQGKLIRVKKETEMGIMTIQENRENNSKE